MEKGAGWHLLTHPWGGGGRRWASLDLPRGDGFCPTASQATGGCGEPPAFRRIAPPLLELCMAARSGSGAPRRGAGRVARRAAHHHFQVLIRPCPPRSPEVVRSPERVHGLARGLPGQIHDQGLPGRARRRSWL